MPVFELQTPDGETYEVDAPDVQSALKALGSVSAPQQQPSQDFAQRAAGMGHQQMVDAYRSTRPGDPWGDYLAERIQQPMQGETPGQAAVRAGGTGSTDASSLSQTGRAAATFLQGVPFAGEYIDEALGAVAPYIGPNSAEDATRAIRQGQEQFQDENPKTALGLKLGGAGAATLATAGLLPRMAAPATLGGRVAIGVPTGAAIGGIEGAVSGYGSGTDDASRTENAQTRGAIGAGLGGVLGAAAPVVQAGIQRGGRWAMDQFNVAREARNVGLSRPSYEILTRAMDADGSLTGQGAQNIQRAGPDAMLADAGPNARAILDTTVQRSGEAGNLARNAIEGRASRANATVTGALDNALGRPQGLQTMERGIRQGSAPARQAAYDAAYAAPIDYSTQQGRALLDMLERVPGNVIQQANRLMQIEGVRSRQILAQIAPDGTVTFQRLPDVRQIDYITRAINQAAESGEGAGALGGQTTIGRAYQNLSRDVRQSLRRLVPEYGQALDTAAEPIAARQALTFGERLFNRGTTRDEVANTLTGMSQAERQQAAAGLRSYIDEKLANVTRALSDTNMDAREAISAVKELSSRANREKVAALVGPQEAARMFRAIDQAATALDLRASVAQNSRTFARGVIDQNVNDYVESGVVNQLRSGRPVNATQSIVAELLGGTPQMRQGAKDRIYNELARALIDPNPQAVLRSLQRIATQNPRNADIARRIANALTVSAGVPAYQTGTQSLTGMAQGQVPQGR